MLFQQSYNKQPQSATFWFKTVQHLLYFFLNAILRWTYKATAAVTKCCLSNSESSKQRSVYRLNKKMFDSQCTLFNFNKHLQLKFSCKPLERCDSQRPKVKQLLLSQFSEVVCILKNDLQNTRNVACEYQAQNIPFSYRRSSRGTGSLVDALSPPFPKMYIPKNGSGNLAASHSHNSFWLF